MKENPLKKNFFPLFFILMKGREQNLGLFIETLLGPPCPVTFWLTIDKFLQLGLFRRNASQKSQASG